MPWKTIKLVGGLTDFRQRLREGKFRCDERAWEMLGGMLADKINKEIIEVGLVKISVAELRFKRGAFRSQIYERALSSGLLSLCPAEVGPNLRLQYSDQPDGELIFLAMEPINDSHDNLNIFALGRSGPELWLEGVSYVEGFCYPFTQWVFCLPPRK